MKSLLLMLLLFCSSCSWARPTEGNWTSETSSGPDVEKMEGSEQSAVEEDEEADPEEAALGLEDLHSRSKDIRER